MDRAILHIRPEHFCVSAERLQHPALQGKAVIVFDGDEGNVISCSDESGAFGVHPAMPVETARKLAPHAIVIPGEKQRYQRLSDEFSRTLADQVPVLEKAAENDYYADLSGIGNWPVCWKWARDLRQRMIRETGIPFTMGLASNKFVASRATAHAGTTRERSVLPGAEKGFLSPLPLEELAFPDEGMLRLLTRRGVLTMGQLARMTPGKVQRLLGKQGVMPWQLANGICHLSVLPYQDPESFSCEVTFSRDCQSVPRLLSLLNTMNDKLCHSLRKKGMTAASVTVKLGYPDFTTAVRKTAVPPVVVGKNLAAKAHDLFHGLYDKSKKVRMIGLRFGELEQGARQMQLFAGPPALTIGSAKRSVSSGYFLDRVADGSVGF